MIQHKTVEERLAYLEAKLERVEILEEQLRRTQQALQNMALFNKYKINLGGVK